MNITIDLHREVKWYAIFTELSHMYPRESIDVITNMTNEYVNGKK